MSVKEVNVLTCHLRYSGKQSFLHQHLFLIHSKKKIHRKTAKNEPLLWKRKGVGTSALIINKPAIDQSGSRHLQHRGVWKRWTFNVQLTETVIVNNLKLWLIKQCLACCMTLPRLTHTHTHTFVVGLDNIGAFCANISDKWTVSPRLGFCKSPAVVCKLHSWRFPRTNTLINLMGLGRDSSPVVSVNG